MDIGKQKDLKDFRYLKFSFSSKFVYISAIIASILIIIVYAVSNIYFNKINEFKFNYVRSIYLQGFANIEEMQRNGIEANWTRKHAVKRIKIRARYLTIPIFTLKPDIKDDPINVEIYAGDKKNGKLIKDLVLNSKDIINIKFDITKLGYKVGEQLDLNFYVDKLWIPTIKEMDNPSIGEVGIAVGYIHYSDN